jgi:hypothetical protein
MRIKNLGLVGFFTLLAAGVAGTSYAQAFHVAADIPFAFQTAGKTLPAGHYDFLETSDSEFIHVTGSATGAEVLAPTMARIASETHGHAGDTHVVFDVVNGGYTLSEIWESGFDGFLLHATKGPHKHHVITVLMHETAK